MTKRWRDNSQRSSWTESCWYTPVCRLIDAWCWWGTGQGWDSTGNNSTELMLLKSYQTVHKLQQYHKTLYTQHIHCCIEVFLATLCAMTFLNNFSNLPLKNNIHQMQSNVSSRQQTSCGFLKHAMHEWNILLLFIRIKI